MPVLVSRPASQPSGLARGLGASITIEAIAKLLCEAQCRLLGADAVTWDTLAPSVKDSMRQHAIAALLRLDPAVELRAQEQVRRRFGSSVVPAIREYNAILMTADPAVSAISSGTMPAGSAA